MGFPRFSFFLDLFRFHRNNENAKKLMNANLIFVSNKYWIPHNEIYKRNSVDDWKKLNHEQIAQFQIQTYNPIKIKKDMIALDFKFNETTIEKSKLYKETMLVKEQKAAKTQVVTPKFEVIPF